MTLYQYQRPFWRSHLRQIRMMIRDGRQVSSARALLKHEQRRLADLRASGMPS